MSSGPFFLGMHSVDRVTQRLEHIAGPPSCPVAAVYRAERQKCLGRDSSISGSLLASEILQNCLLPSWQVWDVYAFTRAFWISLDLENWVSTMLEGLQPVLPLIRPHSSPVQSACDGLRKLRADCVTSVRSHIWKEQSCDGSHICPARVGPDHTPVSVHPGILMLNLIRRLSLDEWENQINTLFLTSPFASALRQKGLSILLR